MTDNQFVLETAADSAWMEERPVRRGFNQVAALYEMLNDGGLPRGYIAGSYAVWMALDEPEWKPNDVDIFAATDEDFSTLEMCLHDAEYLVEYRGEILIKWIRTDLVKQSHDVQLIRPNPRWNRLALAFDILKSFDLSSCRGLLRSPEKVLVDESVGKLNGKILLVNDPVKTLGRLLKYHRRGVNFPMNELLKVFRAWSAMPIEKQELLLQMHAEIIEDSEPEEYGFYDDDDYFYGE